ncbi:MAG: GNAT family N-acetyltransferase, partial [Actinopolymorphaceae bacterium]
MSVPVRRLGDDAWTHVARIIEMSFGSDWPADEQDFERARFEPDRSFGAVDGGEVVGHTCAYSFAMTA